jgi:HK97 family phage prohead protease
MVEVEEIPMHEVEAYHLSAAEYRTWERQWQEESRCWLVDWEMNQLDFKEKLLRERRRKLAAMPKPKPLRDVVSITCKDGIETFKYPHRHATRRMIHGVAATPTITKHNQSKSPLGCEIKLPIPLLCSHSKYERPIGDVTLVRRDRRHIYIQASINENESGDYAWKLIEDGELKALSVGSNDGQVQAEVDGVVFIDRWTLREVSIVRRGANPDCWFEIYKGPSA